MMDDVQIEALLKAHDSAVTALVELAAQVLALPRCRCADGPEAARCDRERGEVVVDSAGERAEYC